MQLSPSFSRMPTARRVGDERGRRRRERGNGGDDEDTMTSNRSAAGGCLSGAKARRTNEQKTSTGSVCQQRAQ